MANRNEQYTDADGDMRCAVDKGECVHCCPKAKVECPAMYSIRARAAADERAQRRERRTE